MELFKAFVTILARDEASSEVEDISNNIMGKLAGAAKTAAKALGALWAGNQIVQFGKQAFYAYSQFEQLQGGVAKLYGNAGQTIEQYAESVGKSIDEVQDAYDRNERAQKLVMDNAQQAWKTAGMDANSYMQTATSFSASLINSLGGDTEEAARLTNEAMVAMSDNVNTFGSDMGSVQNAFQGFAKQNYTMLDNLKLGYGGTKTEMERLIHDASQMTSEQEALNMTVEDGSTSFDNIVRAIQVMQKHQGIYGTTSREAMQTIEGSMNATKAAWQNLIAEIGKPDADIGARIADMATAIMGENGEGGLLRNVVNEVGTIGSNVMNAISNGVEYGLQWLVDNGPSVALNAVKGIIDAITDAASLVETFDLSALFEGMDISSAISGIMSSLGDIGEIFREWSPDIAEAGAKLIESFGTAISNNAPLVASKVGEIINFVINAIVTYGPAVVGKVAETFYSVVEDITSRGPELVTRVVEIIGTVVQTIVQFLIQHGPELLSAAGEMVMNIAKAIANHAPDILGNIAETIGMVIGYVIDAASDMLSAAIEFVGGLLDGSNDAFDDVLEWFGDVPQMILDAIGDVSGLLSDIGLSIINGFWDGMKSAWSGASEWVGGLASWIKQNKGPEEYDKRLLIDNGKWIIGGLNKGLINGFDDVKKTLAYETSYIGKQFDSGFDFNMGVRSDFGSGIAVGTGGTTVITKYYSINGISVMPDSAIAGHIESLYDEVEQYERMGING